MSKLTIRFAGICSHFRNVVPGVPHRVVLPDTGSVRFGLIRVGDDPELVPYYVIPHFPTLKAWPVGSNQSAGTSLQVPGVIAESGYILAGARLSIGNAVESTVTYDRSYQSTPQLSAYMQNYEYSDEVVMRGRAAAYLDIFGGHVEAVTIKDVTHVEITMETFGPPQLMVTPFFSGHTIAPAQYVEFISPAGQGDWNLQVANMEVDRKADDPTFDFILHYLTARGGIPRMLDVDPPGMKGRPVGVSPERVAEALRDLADIICAGYPSAEALFGITPDDLTPSCSDSRYP